MRGSCTSCKLQQEIVGTTSCVRCKGWVGPPVQPDTPRTLDEFVADYNRWHAENFGTPDRYKALLKLNEEVGELHAALYRNERGDVGDALADIFISLFAVALSQGFDLRHEVLTEVWPNVRLRDYRKYPGRGRP